ncbi:MAG: formylglycine-generating enzyme family protein [Pseudomonadota bacterium]
MLAAPALAPALALALFAGPAAAQSTAELCADPGQSCGARISEACLDQVERFGAGSVRAGAAGKSAACEAQMTDYRACLQRVAVECADNRVQSGASSTGCDQATSLKLWQDVKDATNPEELEGLALACPGTAAARLAEIRAKALRRGGGAPSVESAGPVARAAGDRFRDCPGCPEMIAIRAGRFTMGSPDDEPDRASDESPRRTVDVAAFALSRSEVARGEYAAFVAETGYRGGLGSGDVCRTYEDGSWDFRSGRSWRDPGFEQTDRHPVVCVSWEDAQSYIAWLNAKTPNAPYRLPSAAEWEYAARARGAGAYVWGDDPDRGCDHANLYDQTSARVNGFNWAAAACDDGYAFTAPAGSFRENAFGLVDMAGNVWEWTEDCWHESYRGAPSDGAAWMSANGGDCARGGLRGGAWDFKPTSARTANRNRTERGYRGAFVGFRLARDLDR